MCISLHPSCVGAAPREASDEALAYVLSRWCLEYDRGRHRRLLPGQLLRQSRQLGIDADGLTRPPDDEIAGVRTAMANRDDAHAQLARAEQLQPAGCCRPSSATRRTTRLKIAEAAYQSAIDNVRSLKASLQDRRAALELARKKLDDAVIRAPVGGSVSERLVRPGEFIRENTPVVTIVQMDPLKLTTAIQERYADVHPAGHARAIPRRVVPDATFEGRIAYVSPALDQATRTFAVEAVVDNARSAAEARLLREGRDPDASGREACSPCPRTAVSTLAGVSTVFVIEDGKVRQQLVMLGRTAGQAVGNRGRARRDGTARDLESEPARHRRGGDEP